MHVARTAHFEEQCFPCRSPLTDHVFRSNSVSFHLLKLTMGAYVLIEKTTMPFLHSKWMSSLLENQVIATVIVSLCLLRYKLLLLFAWELLHVREWHVLEGEILVAVTTTNNREGGTFASRDTSRNYESLIIYRTITWCYLCS